MATQEKTKHEVLSEFRCSQILQAARRVFARKGFAHTTVEEIAEAAGIAKGTLYLYFRSKRAVYLGALRQGVLALHEKTRQELESAPTTKDKIRAFIATRLSYFEENRDFFKIYHAEFGNMLTSPLSLHKQFKDLYSQQARLLQSAVEEGIEQGTLRPQCAETAAFVIYDVTRALIARRLLGWTARSAEQDAEWIFDLVWNGLRNSRSALSQERP